MDGSRHQLQRFLLSELERRRERNPSFSLRAFAKNLDVQPSTLSEILNGKKSPSSKLARRLVSKLARDADVGDLVAALASGQLTSGKVQDRYNYTKIDLDKFSVIARWHYFAILTICQAEDLRSDEAGIARRLALPAETVQEAVDKLLELGLLERDGNHFRATNSNLSVGENISNSAIQAAHAEHLDLANTALFDVPTENREFLCVNIATQASELKIAKKRLTTFLRALARDLESASKKDTVFRIGLQMFPLTIAGESS